MASQSNVRLAKAIHEARMAQVATKVSAMRRGTVGTGLQAMVDKAYRQGKARGR